MLQGSCLCGDVHWKFDGIPESATVCNCTACRRFGLVNFEDLPRNGRCIRDYWF